MVAQDSCESYTFAETYNHAASNPQPHSTKPINSFAILKYIDCTFFHSQHFQHIFLFRIEF